MLFRVRVLQAIGTPYSNSFERDSEPLTSARERQVIAPYFLICPEVSMPDLFGMPERRVPACRQGRLLGFRTERLALTPSRTRVV